MSPHRAIVVAAIAVLSIPCLSPLQAAEPAMSKQLTDYIDSITSEFDEIAPERKETLQALADYLVAQLKADEPAKLNAICTANSRRSQLTQTWAYTAAKFYGLGRVATHSSGTEASACNPRTVAALKRVGFAVDMTQDGENPVYELRLDQSGTPLKLWSKTIDDESNPKSDFAALMCCSAAAEACPNVPGAALRVPLLYDDPKEADGTADETAAYDERCRQIAREMFWVMSQVAQAE